MEKVPQGMTEFEKYSEICGLSSHQCEQLVEYGKYIFLRNQEFNLTGYKTQHEIYQNLIIDSLTISEINIIPFKGRNLIDVGSGAGIPGIVIKILYPSMEVCFLEASKKKADFIQSVIRLFNLHGTHVVHARSETLAHQEGCRESFFLCCTRALAPMRTALELTIPFLRVGGTAIYIKGPRYQEECEEARNAFQILGCSIKQVKKASVPGIQRENIFVIVKKYLPTPQIYPRKAGIPQKRPL